MTICESGPRAAIAASILTARGYDARAVVDGGIDSWQASGKPTVEFRRCGELDRPSPVGGALDPLASQLQLEGIFAADLGRRAFSAATLLPTSLELSRVLRTRSLACGFGGFGSLLLQTPIELLCVQLSRRQLLDQTHVSHLRLSVAAPIVDA